MILQVVSYVPQKHIVRLVLYSSSYLILFIRWRKVRNEVFLIVTGYLMRWYIILPRKRVHNR